MKSAYIDLDLFEDVHGGSLWLWLVGSCLHNISSVCSNDLETEGDGTYWAQDREAGTLKRYLGNDQNT